MSKIVDVEVTKNELDEFYKRIKSIDSGKLVEKMVDALAERGKEIADNEYNGINVNLYIENVGKGERNLVASGKGLAYIEYGTGTVGEESNYQGNLPTEPRIFESRGATQTTDGWEYNYYKKQHSDKPNLKDWKGFKAQAQMFNTATQLEKEAVDICKQVIKGD